MPYRALADAVLIIHVGVVLFVVLGLAAIFLGNRAGWSWVNGFWWRAAHLAAIVVVALQAWLGRYCPLTILESWLREQAGQPAYARSFIQHWLQQLIYYDAPLWLFAIVYTMFGGLVVWAWRRFPPERRRTGGPGT